MKESSGSTAGRRPQAKRVPIRPCTLRHQTQSGSSERMYTRPRWRTSTGSFSSSRRTCSTVRSSSLSPGYCCVRARKPELTLDCQRWASCRCSGDGSMYAVRMLRVPPAASLAASSMISSMSMNTVRSVTPIAPFRPPLLRPPFCRPARKQYEPRRTGCARLVLGNAAWRRSLQLQAPAVPFVLRVPLGRPTFPPAVLEPGVGFVGVDHGRQRHDPLKRAVLPFTVEVAFLLDPGLPTPLGPDGDAVVADPHVRVLGLHARQVDANHDLVAFLGHLDEGADRKSTRLNS